MMNFSAGDGRDSVYKNILWDLKILLESVGKPGSIIKSISKVGNWNPKFYCNYFLAFEGYDRYFCEYFAIAFSSSFTGRIRCFTWQ